MPRVLSLLLALSLLLGATTLGWAQQLPLVILCDSGGITSPLKGANGSYSLLPDDGSAPITGAIIDGISDRDDSARLPSGQLTVTLTSGDYRFFSGSISLGDQKYYSGYLGTNTCTFPSHLRAIYVEPISPDGATMEVPALLVEDGSGNLVTPLNGMVTFRSPQGEKVLTAPFLEGAVSLHPSQLIDSGFDGGTIAVELAEETHSLYQTKLYNDQWEFTGFGDYLGTKRFTLPLSYGAGGTIFFYAQPIQGEMDSRGGEDGDTPAPPAATLTPEQAAAAMTHAVTTALEQAPDAQLPVEVRVVFQGPGSTLSAQCFTAMEQAAKTAAGGRAIHPVLCLDTLGADGTILNRIYLEFYPAAQRGEAFSWGVNTRPDGENARISALFARHFTNPPAVFSLEQGTLPPDGLSLALRHPNLSPGREELCLYAYDPVENSYTRLSTPLWWDGNGYLHLTPREGRIFLLSKGPLEPRP